MYSKTITAVVDLWRTFRRREDGQVAVIFALAMLPAAIGVGAAVDYSRGNRVRTGLQTALDSAVLAAAIDGTSNWRQVATNTFDENVNKPRPPAGHG